MIEKLEACFNRLQTLESFVPTIENMEKLLKSLYEIREVYQELTKEGEQIDGAAVDPDGRDSN